MVLRFLTVCRRLYRYVFINCILLSIIRKWHTRYIRLKFILRFQMSNIVAIRCPQGHYHPAYEKNITRLRACTPSTNIEPRNFISSAILNPRLVHACALVEDLELVSCPISRPRQQVKYTEDMTEYPKSSRFHRIENPVDGEPSLIFRSATSVRPETTAKNAYQLEESVNNLSEGIDKLASISSEPSVVRKVNEWLNRNFK